MSDAHSNFAVSTVATAPSPATSGNTLVVHAGDGALFPVAPFNATVWPAGVQPTAANAEIVRVTVKATNTFTITRMQEGTTARAIIVGDQIAQTVSAFALDQVDATYPSTANLRFCDRTNGNDSNSGLTAKLAFLTSQAAYNSLPSTGGILVFLDGLYDVADCVQGVMHKPAVVMSLSSYRSKRGGPISDAQSSVIFYSSTHATALWKTQLPTDASQTNGWEFHGVRFDISDPLTTQAVYAPGTNHVVIDDCGCDGLDNDPVEKYLIRGYAATAGDASWHRITRNNCRYCGVAYEGKKVGANYSNSNQHLIADNVCFPGTASWGVRLEGNTRSVTSDNNIEGDGTSGVIGGIFLDHSYRCRCEGDAGEGNLTPYIRVTGGGNNYLDPIGPNTLSANQVLIEDNSGLNHYGSLAAMKGSGPAWLRATATGDNVPTGFAGEGLIYPAFATLPVRRSRDLLPVGGKRFSLVDESLLTAEYWDGAAWQAWTPTSLAKIAYPNTDGFAVDATHQRFRISTGAILDSGGDAPIVEGRFNPYGATTGSNFTVSVDRINAADAVTEAGVPYTIGNYQTGIRGCAVPLPWKTSATKLRIEFDFTTYFSLSGHSFTFTYLAVESQNPIDTTNISGQEFKGLGSPEGVVKASVGSRYWRLDGAVSTALYSKVTGTGNTGWATVGAGNVAADAIWDAKGDLAVGTGADTAARLAAGVNGLVLTTDSTQTTGLKWAAAPTGILSVITRLVDSAIIASNTTLANDNTLLFAMSGNGTDIWLVDVTLLVAAANATMDIKIGWAYPTAALAYWGGVGTPTTVEDFGAAPPSGTLSNSLKLQSQSDGFGTIAGTAGLMLRAIFFDGGTAGTVHLQWAQNTSDAGNLFLRKGSYIQLTKLA